jgi:NADH-quinone oxidoreductase subunit J
MTLPFIMFFVFALIAIGGALLLIMAREPIHSALSLIVVMMSLAGLYLMLGAEFVAAVQIIVYAGAIMVLFVFVIMLLNAGGESRRKGSAFARIAGIPLLLILLGMLAYFIGQQYPNADLVQFGVLKDAAGQSMGSAQNVGTAIFTTYLLPFEVTSVLILIAIIGAIVLARKELD